MSLDAALEQVRWQGASFGADSGGSGEGSSRREQQQSMPDSALLSQPSPAPGVSSEQLKR